MEEILGRTQRERDVTYRELRDRNQQLQQRLVDLADAHEQLQEAQKMLVHGERLSAMGQMAAAIVHDLNGPLAVIAGNAELMTMRDGGGRDREELTSILEAVRRVHALSGHLLDLSGRRRANLATTDLNDLVSDVVRFLTPMMSGVEVETRLDAGLPAVEADASQLEQVLTNLVMNALDAVGGTSRRALTLRTGCGTVAALVEQEHARGRETLVAVQLDPSRADGPWLWAEVEDTGAGMDPDHLEKAFEVFYTTKGEQGTGLGLAISKRIVEAQRGSILAASAPGAGTSVRLLLSAPDSMA